MADSFRLKPRAAAITTAARVPSARFPGVTQPGNRFTPRGAKIGSWADARFRSFPARCLLVSRTNYDPAANTYALLASLCVMEGMPPSYHLKTQQPSGFGFGPLG